MSFSVFDRCQFSVDADAADLRGRGDAVTSRGESRGEMREQGKTGGAR